MSLAHALLGFLTYAPLSGYQLKQVFDQSVHHFWNANLSQIYPTLGQMERQGWLSVEVQYQDDAPNRKLYHLTAAGRAELARWLAEPQELPPARLPFLVKVFFAGALPKGVVLAQLRDQLARHQARLAVYQGPTRAALEQWVERTGQHRHGAMWRLTLDAGHKLEEAWVAWCEEAIATVEALPDDAGAGGTEEVQR